MSRHSSPTFVEPAHAFPADANASRKSTSAPFRLKKWLRLHGVDIVTLAVMGAITLVVHSAGPASTRSFPLYQPDSAVVYPQFSYPRRKQIIPTWASALIAFFVPFFFISLFQIRRRSVDDWLTTTFGLLRGIVTSALFQVMIKWLIGGLRPHFYDACIPNPNASSPGPQTTLLPSYSRSICSGDSQHTADALESAPSGHTTASWSGLFFLALYFNAQLKVMSNHNPAYWKMVVFFAPLLGACLLSGNLEVDHHHHWYDILIGACIGITGASVAFRQTFASIFDFRFNHVLLPRVTSLFHRRSSHHDLHPQPYYAYQPTMFASERDAPFTSEGGWGDEAHLSGLDVCGAPGDATALGIRSRSIGY